MTNEKAIEFGKFWLDMNSDSKNSLTYQFFEMAIKALEKDLVLDKVRAEIKAIAINGQLDEHTMFMRAEEQVKQMSSEIIDKYRAESEVKE